MIHVLVKSAITCALLLFVPALISGTPPSCSDVSNPKNLCNLSCSSMCRGFPPGFSTPTCVDNSDCVNTPPWANGSVCTCSPSPSPGPAPSPTPPMKNGTVGAYLLLNNIKELNVLASNAETLPITRLLIAFLRPDLVYVPKSMTLNNTGLSQYKFAEVKTAITTLTSAGIEVFISIGGWNFNCYPYLYAYYSVGGYGTNTPNYWEIKKYGNGDIKNCVEENQYCYVCEPPTENTTIQSFGIFPEPKGQTHWEAAKRYIEGSAPGDAPTWNEDVVPGTTFTDPKTSITSTVPGHNLFQQLQRDPYQDIVFLADDLGATGIDLDYEEIWHADYHKTLANGGTQNGPWNLYQTMYKYGAIAKDILSNIDAIKPSLKLSTAASAAGAWSGKWWGGNLKGVWLMLFNAYPELAKRIEVGVMTYDLSDDSAFHECPDDNDCTLSKQVNYYMNTYKEAAINGMVGYEIGTPAYPSPVYDKQYQLPLTEDELQSIIANTQPNFHGGFLWDIFKPAEASDQVSATEVAQAICNTVRRGDARCQGQIPDMLD